VTDSLILSGTGSVEEKSAACSDGFVDDTGVRKMILSFYFPSTFLSPRSAVHFLHFEMYIS
jgi:hypothetical protein